MDKQRRFFCTQCSRCCRFEEGFVFLTRTDLNRLCAFLQETESDFIDRHCRWVSSGLGSQLSLREQPNKDCVFWRDGGCVVYDARPTQCRTYPFWRHIVEEPDGWVQESLTCPGIGVGPVWSRTRIARALDDRQRELPITRERLTGGNTTGGVE